MKRGILILTALAILGCGLANHAVQGGDKKVDTRVFEMRTYYANKGKMKALDDRFRDHTNKLFEKHGMTIIGFWKPTPSKKGQKVDENKLVYILAYPSIDAARASWDAFKKDPDWIKAKNASEVDGVLVAKVVSEYLKPTDYSPIK